MKYITIKQNNFHFDQNQSTGKLLDNFFLLLSKIDNKQSVALVSKWDDYIFFLHHLNNYEEGDCLETDLFKA